MRTIYQQTCCLIKKLYLASLVLMFFLWSICFYYQIYKHPTYFHASQKNRFKIHTIQPKRGSILDRHGKTLAYNLPSYNVILDRTNLSSKNTTKIIENLDLSLNQLAIIKRKLKWSPHHQPVLIQPNISKTEALEILIKQPSVLSVQAQPKRSYPFGSYTSTILGYLANDENSSPYQPLKGQSGIEKFYDKELKGRPGYLHIETNAKGTQRKTINQTPSIGGNQLILTLDLDLQKTAVNVLKPYKGAVVALAPYTGDILAMVSSPTYNANEFIDPNISIYELLNNPNKPLFNRAIKGQFPLASTIKPFLSLYALDQEIISPEHTIHDVGFFQVNSKSRKFKDWKASGHGKVNLYKAIVVSCDTFFYELSLKLGIKGIQTALSPFGFGEPTHVDLPHEKKGFIPSKAWKMKKYNQPWYLGDTIISGIGQGAVLSTPLQLAAATATLATRGKHYQPRLVKSILTQNTQIKHMPIHLLNTVQYKESTWDAVIKAMKGVVTDPIGTGHRFGSPSYSVAAKTGTAQVISQQKINPKSQSNLHDHSLFIAFAPINQPEIAIAVILENNPNAPTVARQVLDQFFKLSKTHNDNSLNKSDMTS
ncbi:MAG TPA: penicillin-binding protein 2 [Gammaproteobacteria bacterium]|nr:penicillin-binding protein 2 [Gammaproteobacteria bacterium]